MKIKEIEVLTGMSRDNIRFYERCGLLEPYRNENGYREYSDENVLTLKKIKLLRTLHISIDDIKEIQLNQLDLTVFLNTHIKNLKHEIKDLENSTHVCEKIISDQIQYEHLNPDTYNYLFENNQTNEIENDVLKPLCSPWKRFFARDIDMMIYTFIIIFIFNNILKINIFDEYNHYAIIQPILKIILLILIEPILLSKFGYTIGKYILGIKVTNDQGYLLTYRQAFDRTKNLIIHLCFYIPFIYHVCLFSYFKKCNHDEFCPWENESIETIVDEKSYRYVVYGFIYLAILALSLFIANPLNKIPNKGEMSVSDFIENYEYCIDSLDYEMKYTLNEDGNWVDDENKIVHDPYYPKIDFIVDNNICVGLSIHVELENVEKISNYEDICTTLIQTYLTSQDINSNKIINFIESYKFKDYEYQLDNIIIKFDYEYINFEKGLFENFPGKVMVSSSPNNSYSFEFMIKQEK